MFGARKPSDEEILQKMRDGDQRMLLRLYERNYNPIRNHILQNSGTETDTEDMLQEALVIVWQQAQKPDFSLTSKLDTFIYGIVKNLWMKQLRKDSRTTLTDFQENQDYMSHSQEEDNNETSEDTMKVLVHYLDQLSEACRDILQLFYFDELDMDQIATRLNFANADTVKAKKYQCKKKLELLLRKNFSAQDLL